MSFSPTEETSDHIATLEMIINEANLRLAAQTQLMLAADSRANAVMAAATAMSAAALAVAANEAFKNDARIGLLWAAIGVASACAMAATLGLAALWPTSIAVQGSSPKIFEDDVISRAPRATILRELAGLLAERIERNRTCSTLLTRRIRWAMAALAASPLIGGVSGSVAIGGEAQYVACGLAVIAFVVVLLFFGLSKKRRP